jgi:hypothetical protein
MAKFNSTTFGTISGRHGSAVASTTKDGKSILRVFKAPSNPNTEAQITQRSKFGFVNSELSSLREIFKVTFRDSRGMNKAVSCAIKEAVIGNSSEFSIDYSKLMFASGSIQLPEEITAVAISDDGVKLDWDTTLRMEDENPDELNVVLMNVESKFTILRENTALRSAGTITISVPDIWKGVDIYCWIYFSTPENKLTSNSKFIGTLKI